MEEKPKLMRRGKEPVKRKEENDAIDAG